MMVAFNWKPFSQRYLRHIEGTATDTKLAYDHGPCAPVVDTKSMLVNMVYDPVTSHAHNESAAQGVSTIGPSRVDVAHANPNMVYDMGKQVVAITPLSRIA